MTGFGLLPWRRWLARVVLGAVVIVLLVVGGTAFRVWQYGRIDDRGHADVILVLGAAEYDGTPSSVLQARLNHADTLYQQGVADQIITVGGRRPGDAYTEAEAGQKYLSKLGVPAGRLTEVNTGNDTLTSLQAAAAVLRDRGWSTAVLVSDPWHMFRSEIMAGDSGIDVWTSPTHSGPVVRSRETQMLYIGRETAALLFYRATRAPADGIGLSLG
ncbi:MAG TPA: YdcF family protein [Pseudonocardiaceae bacterium]|jgi:uncharacterized SAM-binding protein YcdF (DUF218 family)|nr:YdcF family protein [Pseudonocardiaceae bacterium]